MNAMFNMKGTKVLGTHYSLPNIHFRVLSLTLKIVCPDKVKGFKGKYKMEKSGQGQISFLIERKQVKCESANFVLYSYTTTKLADSHVISNIFFQITITSNQGW